MSMLERIGRAVFAVQNPQAASHPLTDYDSEWANRRGDYLGMVTPSRVDVAASVARAAVEAMRESTGNASFAGAMAAVPHGCNLGNGQVQEIWTAMIDAILQDPHHHDRGIG